MVRSSRKNRRIRAAGQATTEYVLILALIVIPIAAAFRLFKDIFRDLLVELNRLVIGPGV